MRTHTPRVSTPRAVALLSLALVLLTTQASGQTDDVARSLDEYLSARTEAGRFSGAVLVARGDRVIFRQGYGFADVERRVPYTPETRHQIASITKMFTSMAALKLRDRGHLRLEDSICKYLKDCPAIWEPVTVHHLMRHNSGIPDYEEKLELGSDKYMQFMARRKVVATIYEDAKRQPLDFRPGEKFKYSNTGYIVLGYVIAAAARRPFAEVLTETVLRPAGLTRTGVLGRGATPKDIANGYTFGDIGWEKTLAGYPLTSGHLKARARVYGRELSEEERAALTPAAGDGSLYGTLDDLLRWSRIMDGGKFVPAAEAAEVFAPGLDGYGYGWISDTSFERKRLRHTGSLPGYTSQLIKFPEEKVTIIIFSNLDRARMGAIVRDVTAIVFGKPYDLPVRGRLTKLTAEQTAALVGDYKTADGTLLTIRNEPDYLTAQIKDQYTAGLIPLSPTEFYFPLADGRAVFTLDAAGKAAHVNMRYSGADHVAERVAP
ncbi:MAG TPA: serine hydrolase domain-containing protein [Pyrinomonadaceae bacterium]|nr:serine hydrolase domain-containing protein [Pyrinomonadaceae bacterium]